MISDDIKKESKGLAERGIPEGSFFTVRFADGSSADERDTNWSEISEQARVGYFGKAKTVFLCRLPAVSVTVRHDGLEATIEVPEGCGVYQAMRSSSTISASGQAVHSVVGRVVGIVRDGEVAEEMFLDAAEGRVHGLKS